jgi:hypothetical protein
MCGHYNEVMFFRTETAKKMGFQDYLNKAKEAGFTVTAGGEGQAKISRKNVAAIVQDVTGCPPKLAESPGIVVGTEIARLVDGGYQKFIMTPSGKKRAALAADLYDVHNFEEDLRAAMEMPGTYNLSLGTVSNQYIYDRVEERDGTTAKEPWKVPIFLQPKA